MNDAFGADPEFLGNIAKLVDQWTNSSGHMYNTPEGRKLLDWFNSAVKGMPDTGPGLTAGGWTQDTELMKGLSGIDEHSVGGKWNPLDPRNRQPIIDAFQGMRESMGAGGNPRSRAGAGWEQVDIRDIFNAKNLNFLAQDVGNRANVVTGLGDMAATVMMNNMAQQSPELMQWHSGYGIQPQKNWD